jgi:DNA-binding response OmpR family regulator
MPKILIAEDDRELRHLFSRVLQKNGYDTVCASNGKDAFDAAGKEFFDLIISDIMMPKMDGYALISALREAGNLTPIMIISAKGDLDDMREGYSLGADDYMVKPINVNEMVLKVAAQLRRADMMREHKLTLGQTVLEIDTLTVRCGEDTQILPQKEFLLLYKMASEIGKIFTRVDLMQLVWGYENETDTHTVDVHIARLRERFKSSPDFKIETIRGVGYKVVKL